MARAFFCTFAMQNAKCRKQIERGSETDAATQAACTIGILISAFCITETRRNVPVSTLEVVP
jgi:hypothetical protein